MKRIGALVIAVAMTGAACGGSDDTVVEPDVEVEAVDDDGALRLAGGGQVIAGCRIEPNTRCPGANLAEADLSGANLEGAYLQDAILRGAILRGVNLRGARLSAADLSWVNLSGADLSGAVLRGVRFCGTTMPDNTVRNDGCRRPT